MNMDDKTIDRIYIQVYFWMFFAVQTLLLVFGTELHSPRGIANTIFTYLAFIPFFGYIHEKKYPTKNLWRLFAGLFFLWQMAGFFFLYDHLVTTKLMLFLLMAPFFWAVALYAVITVEENPDRKDARIQKIEAFKKKFRGIMTIAGAFSLLLLGVSLFVMLAGKFNLPGNE
jgi:hypothetical protein